MIASAVLVGTSLGIVLAEVRFVVSVTWVLLFRCFLVGNEIHIIDGT